MSTPPLGARFQCDAPYQLLFPQDPKNSVAIICNGEMTISDELIKKISAYSSIIAVDGGLNQCHQMNITPNIVVGDIDSVQSEVLEKYTNIPQTVLSRAKDFTDLEAAISKAQNINAQALITIFGGLGKRIDHTLGNIFVSMRNPGKVILESENEVVFAISNASVFISHPSAESMTLVPLTGTTKGITLTDNGDYTDIIPILERGKPRIRSFNCNCTVNIDSGELLIILNKNKIEPATLNKSELGQEYTNPLLEHTFEYLAQDSSRKDPIKWSINSAELFSIRPSSGTVSFDCEIGQSVSLFPLYGPATSVKTTGLKWELGPESTSTLDKNFISFNNIATDKTFSVSIKTGELVCIINPLVDKELLNLEPCETKLQDIDSESSDITSKTQSQENNTTADAEKGELVSKANSLSNEELLKLEASDTKSQDIDNEPSGNISKTQSQESNTSSCNFNKKWVLSAISITGIVLALIAEHYSNTI